MAVYVDGMSTDYHGMKMCHMSTGFSTTPPVSVNQADYGDAIRCLDCNMTSYNVNDVRNGYCGNCNLFLDPTEYTIIRKANGEGTQTPKTGFVCH